jgi:GNAT superfamily N-acetyltransferase
LEENHLVIRDAYADELDKVSLLIRDSYLQYEKFMPPQAWQSYLQDMMDVGSRLPDSQLIVAELKGDLAGAVTLYPEAEPLSMERLPEGWAYIRLLSVHPAYRGRGIGRALVEECIRRCRIRGVAAIALHTTEMMDVARRIYENMGFVRAPELDAHPAPNVTVMAYRLDLT